MRLSLPLYLLTCAFLAACTTASSPAPDTDQPWLVHCETDKSYTPDIRALPGIYDGRWLWAEHAPGEQVFLKGSLENGFFHLHSAITASGTALPSNEGALRQLCLDTISREEPRDLARVLAARDSQDIDIPIIYPNESQAPGKVTRLVVFGDSLSDAGRLKHRMQVFPGKPYWLGRFSNGPVWPDYLEASTELAIQNRSYGGASVDEPLDMQEAGLIAFIKDEGRFFVSGSLKQQISDFLEISSLPGQVTDPDKTAFLIWAGANDYISKEPFTGLITTFLNTSRGEFGFKSVADATIDGLLTQVETLYQAGARKFLVINLPDLGRSPIVLQNDSYNSGLGLESDKGRRIELSKRLTLLTDYHNKRLAESVSTLETELPDAHIVLVDSQSFMDDIFAGRLFTDKTQDFDYGFSLTELHEELNYEDYSVSLQRHCYSGSYIGPFNEEDICKMSKTAFFWDIIHPGTYTHCWQAYQVKKEMALAGWIEQTSSPASYRQWCKAQSNQLLD